MGKEQESKLSTFFGLPAKVVFCKRCVMSNQKPYSASEFRNSLEAPKATMEFDNEGICVACRFAESKELVDWESRKHQLHELCERFRSNDGSFDCLVPGSGGKDSSFASHVLRDEFGMHPLTVTWAPHMYTPWGLKNFHNWIASGVSNVLVTPNGRLHRLLTRLALERLLHPFQPFILGQKILAPRLAKQLGIPLVFYGEPQAEYGNPRGEGLTPIKPSSYFAGKRSPTEPIRVAGVDLDLLRSSFPEFEADLSLYEPLSEDDLADSNVEFHYLGYYLRWHPQSCYYYAVDMAGFQAAPERSAGTYSKYSSIDDKIDDLHYYTTFIKFGIGRATYDAAQEIRSGDINRDEGVALVKRFDGEWPGRFIPELMEYLSLPEKEFPVLGNLIEERTMTEDRFRNLCDEFRSPHLWEREGTSSDWRLRHAVWH